MKQVFCLLVFCFSFLATAQIKVQEDLQLKRPTNNGVNNIGNNQDHGETTVKYDRQPVYTDYKVISLERDTTVIDTTLSLKKEYKFNFLRKDDFEQMNFHNQGQTHTKLGYRFDNVSFLPTLGAQAKHYNYFGKTDIKYYSVATPTSEVMVRTGFEQGQVAHSFFTANLNERFNLSIAYNGLRSLGKYRHALSSHGNFVATTNYQTKNKRYALLAHYAAQDLTNQENGGLTTGAKTLFENNEERYRDRARLETNYTNAESFLIGKRYFLQHDYKLFASERDSLNTKYSDLKIGHEFSYETKHYRFSQTSANNIFGNAYRTSIYDYNSHRTMNNQAYVSFQSPYVLGRLKAKVGYVDYNYSYKGVVFTGTNTIPKQLKGNLVTAGAEWKAKVNNFHLKADLNAIVSGDLTGSRFHGEAFYKKDSVLTAKGSLTVQSRAPNFNFSLYQSDYIDYNWINNFENEQIRDLGFELLSNKFVNASAHFTQVDNYTYFDASNKPNQENIGYLKLKVNKAFSVGKFTLENTLMYQNVSKGQDAFRVPDFVTRNTLYFSDHVFKGKPMFLQTGVTFKYFTKYQANAYNPLLSEFTIQNDTEIGGFPMLDFFINAQIRRTRLYLKAENFTGGFTGRKYYSAPNYPYRDFTVRFGLVWNWFI